MSKPSMLPARGIWQSEDPQGRMPHPPVRPQAYLHLTPHRSLTIPATRLAPPPAFPRTLQPALSLHLAGASPPPAKSPLTPPLPPAIVVIDRTNVLQCCAGPLEEPRPRQGRRLSPRRVRSHRAGMSLVSATAAASMGLRPTRTEARLLGTRSTLTTENNRGPQIFVLCMCSPSGEWPTSA